MPSKLLNTTLSGVNMGVTQQYQEGRFDSQVDKMFNCMPTITRGVMRRNPVESVGMLQGLPADLADAFVYSYDRNTGDEQYIVIIPGDGSINVYNANTATVIYKETGHQYLQIPQGELARDSFKALTIADHTFVVNTTKTVEIDTYNLISSEGYDDMAFYWIKKTASVITKQYQSTTEVGSLMRGYEYTLNGANVVGTEDTRPGQEQIDLNTASLIAEEFVRVSGDSLVAASEDSICFNANFTGSDWKWSDTFGDEASLGVWKTVEDSSELPINMPKRLDGFLVRVSGGTSGEFDDYFLKYIYESKTWKEVPAPGAAYKLIGDTMPHVLYRLGDGGFTFDTFKEVADDGVTLGDSAWGERDTGGLEALDDPSFIGQKLNNLFFFKNRLGFITDGSIIMSQTGAYGDFFVQTLQIVLDDDPIDLAVASTDVTVLRHAVSTAGQLILFSDDTQFTVEAIDGPFTPLSAEVNALSNYTYGKKADAVSIGNRVYFGNQVGGYSQIYSYQIAGAAIKAPEAIHRTIHVPSYIDSSLDRIVGHDVLGYVFFETTVYPRELVVLSTVDRGDQELQNAFHRWTFYKNLVSSHVINNELYLVFSDGDLCKMSLEIPGNIGLIDYRDNFSLLAEPLDYISYLDFSQFFVRDANGKGTVRGRYQLRTLQYTISEYSSYLTTIYSTDNILDSIGSMGPAWDDTIAWDDSNSWGETDTFYTREYYNDDKVTIMSDSKKVNITFRSSPIEPSKGFELATVNIEAFFSQRSTRK